MIATAAESEGLTAAAAAIWGHLTDDAPTFLEVAEQELLIAELLGRVAVDIEDGHALRNATSLPPVEAIEWFKRKRIVSPAAFKRLQASAKLRAFSIAGLTSQFGLTEAHRVLTEAVEVGTSQREAVKQLEQVFASAGLTGKRHHLDIVFRNNVLSAYQAGRYKQLRAVAKRRPYWKYRTVGDERVRPAHRAMNGRTYRADNPVWSTWYPPNGHQCRCSIESLSRRDVERERTKIERDQPKEEPDRGWAGSPETIASAQASARATLARAQRLRVLKPPKLAKRGSKPYTDVGDIGPDDVARKAKVVEDLTGLSRTQIDEAIRAGRFSIERVARRLPKGVVQARVPVPSAFADAAEQLLSTAAADPRTAGLVRGVRILPRAWLDPRKAAATRLDAVAVSGGSGGTDLVIVLTGRTSQAEALAAIAARVEAGAPGAVRRAIPVADVVLRGVDGTIPGYRQAFLLTKKAGSAHEARLTRARKPGFFSERVLVTEAKWSDIK